MPYHCMGHLCTGCGAVHAFSMSDAHRASMNLSENQCGCANIQYHPANEMCQGRLIATCPFCSGDHWESHDLLSALQPTRLDGDNFQYYVPPSDRTFIGPRYQAPEPCRCQACDR